MLKKASVMIVLGLLITVSFSPLLGSAETTASESKTNGTTLYVGGSGPGNYSNIHDAYRNCSEGDTIFIYNGVYVFSPWSGITVNKNNVTFCGEDMMETILDGQEELGENYFRVYGDNVCFRNLHFRKPEKHPLFGGPRHLNSRGKATCIEYCYFDAAIAGVMIFNSTLIFRNNVVEPMWISTALGITSLDSSPDDFYIIENNTLYDSVICGSLGDDGEYNVLLKNNSFNGGMFVMKNITGLKILNNTFTDMEILRIGEDYHDMPNYDVLIEGNHIFHSSHYDGSDYTIGMEMWRSYNVTVRNNVFEGCGESLCIEDCEEVEVLRNDFIEGGVCGVSLNNRVDDIEIHQNNFAVKNYQITFFLNDYDESDFGLSNNYYARRFLPFKIHVGLISGETAWRGRRWVIRYDHNPADEPFDI